MTQIIIIPITTLQELCKRSPEVYNFLRQVPLESIIDIILSTPFADDVSTCLWDEVTHKLTDDQIDNLDIVRIDFLFGLITELLYEELHRYTNNYETEYEVYFWLPDSVCLTLRESKRETLKNEYNYINSEF